MDLSVVIVSYNTEELLKRCLESLIIQDTRYKIQDTEVIVVDNGSEDGSKEYLKSQKSKVKPACAGRTTTQNLKLKIILNDRNLGFAKANNQGIKEAQGEYILLLNSDTEVKSGALEKLIEFAKEHPEAGVIGARLLSLDSSIQPSVYHLPTIWRAIREYWLGQKGTYEKYAPTVSRAVSVEAVTGAVMLIPRKKIGKIGLLDERYFMYFEDLDYCRKVKRAGFKVYYLPTAEIIHRHGASGQEIPDQTRQWLVQSSKTYHGPLKHYLINFIIFTAQKWQKFLRKIKA